VWLVDERGATAHITISADWCLLVEEGAPDDGYDMGEHGFISVGPIGDATPFARHVGSTVRAVREEHHPLTGRVALELDFVDGGVRCDGWAGDLRLSELGVVEPTAQRPRSV
jgi:hypothetical protein